MKIIRNKEDLLIYIEANANLKFEFFAPSVRTAERQYLLPVVGQAVADKMAAAIIANDASASQDLKDLLAVAQEAVANIAMALAVSRLAVSFDENGARRNDGTNVKSAFQYQEINLRESYVRAGFNAIDDLLGLLETSNVYPEWKESSAFKDYKRYFLQSGLQFNENFNIRNARYTYLSVRYIMQRIEMFDLKPSMGAALYTKIKEQILASEVEPAYEQLLADYIRPALALLTMSRAVFEKAVDVSDFGVTINIIQDNSNSQQRQPAPLDKIKEVSLQLREDGSKYLSLMAEEIAANPDKYPDYIAPGTEAALVNFKNKQENSFIAV
jgi:hypothetical protein